MAIITVSVPACDRAVMDVGLTLMHAVGACGMHTVKTRLLACRVGMTRRVVTARGTRGRAWRGTARGTRGTGRGDGKRHGDGDRRCAARQGGHAPR